MIKEGAKFQEVGESVYIPINGGGQEIGKDLENKYRYFYDTYDEALNGMLVNSESYYYNECWEQSELDVNYQVYCSININYNYALHNNLIEKYDSDKIYIFTKHPEIIDVDFIYGYLNKYDLPYNNNIEIITLPKDYSQFTYNPILSERYGVSQTVNDPVLVLADWTKYGYIENMIGNSAGNYVLFSSYDSVKNALVDSNLYEVGEIFYKKTQQSESLITVKNKLSTYAVQVIFLLITLMLISNILSYTYVISNKKKIAVKKIYGYSSFSLVKDIIVQLFSKCVVIFILILFYNIYLALFFFILSIIFVILIYTQTQTYISNDLIKSIKGA